VRFRVALGMAVWGGFVLVRQLLAGYIAMPPGRLPYRPGTLIADGHTGSFTWVVTHHVWISVFWASWAWTSGEAAALAVALTWAMGRNHGAWRPSARWAILGALGILGSMAALSATGCCGIVLPSWLLETLFYRVRPLAPWVNGATVALSVGVVAAGLSPRGLGVRGALSGVGRRPERRGV